MQDLDLKEKVLDEIMEMMEQRESEGLKKHPKLLAAKVEVEEPKVEAIEVEPKIEEKASEDEITPEMIQALMDHFKDLK